MHSLLDVTTVVFMAIALSIKDKAAEKETIKYSLPPPPPPTHTYTLGDTTLRGHVLHCT